MTTATSPSAAPAVPATLRRLYLVRFGFALVWALLLLVSASKLGPLSVTLLVLYPLFDVAAAVVDLRSSKNQVLLANIVISALATVGLAIAAASGIPAVLRVWGAWAIVAGLVQLVVAVRRRALGGQWPMILSGGISVLAGSSFALMASADDPSLANVGGYAILGGIFFLVSALRLRG
ncbi:hypothetical protein [Kribbella sp. NPDC051770]|uniref:hypothetical protein n=1 Tax=Kribbella sp. NPDC051770 TaxID=3155413 RepID=UPI003435D448